MSDQPFEDYESQPIRERGRRKVKTPLIVKVLVFDIATDTQIREHPEVNFSIAKHRDWVNSLIVWAVCNGKSVEIVSPNDDR